MVNNIVKIYTIKLEHFNLPLIIASYFKYKTITIEYECTWNGDAGYYQPTNLTLLKVWRDLDRNSESLDSKNMWEPHELPIELKVFLESGLENHANSQVDKPIVIE